MGAKQRYKILFWTNRENSIQHNNSCTTTYLPSHSLSKDDEQHIQITAQESMGKLIRNIFWQTSIG